LAILTTLNIKGLNSTLKRRHRRDRTMVDYALIATSLRYRAGTAREQIPVDGIKTLKSVVN
jgi:hypothetical protein